MYNLYCMADPIEVLLGKSLSESGLWLAVAESCTGGLLGHRITNVPGSSEYFKGGVISYAYEVKRDLLGVSMATLEAKGAVSEETVLEMAKGVRKELKADIGLSVSGIAGPDGGSDDKPVGTVWFAWAVRDGANSLVDTSCELFSGDRDLVRELTVAHALQGVLERIES